MYKIITIILLKRLKLACVRAYGDKKTFISKHSLLKVLWYQNDLTEIETILIL